LFSEVTGTDGFDTSNSCDVIDGEVFESRGLKIVI